MMFFSQKSKSKTWASIETRDSHKSSYARSNCLVVWTLPKSSIEEYEK